MLNSLYSYNSSTFNFCALTWYKRYVCINVCMHAFWGGYECVCTRTCVCLQDGLQLIGFLRFLTYFTESFKIMILSFNFDAIGWDVWKLILPISSLVEGVRSSLGPPLLFLCTNSIISVLSDFITIKIVFVNISIEFLKKNSLLRTIIFNNKERSHKNESDFNPKLILFFFSFFSAFVSSAS